MATAAPSTVIQELRTRVSEIATPRDEATLPFGIDAVDDRLAGRGLSTAALHEMASSRPALGEEAATTLFLGGIAARLAAGGSPALWVVTRFDLYSPGLEQVGLGPDKIVFVEAREDKEVLAVMEDALRHGGPAAVMGEVRRADMTATRRLQLAAAEGSTPALLHRLWRRSGSHPLEAPSTAATRWSIGCAPSSPLGIPGVGRPRWTVELVRQRNGNPFSLILEGCDAQGRLGLPAATADRAVAQGHAASLAA